MGPKTMFMAITALERLEGRANIRDGNYLYVMRYGDRDSKIGISIAPQKRLRQLRPTGVGDLVRQWFRPAGDAQEVEAVAHRVLSQWRHRISGQRERFRAGADTACLAVQLAIGLAEEERAEAARLAVDRRNIQVRSLRLAPLGLLPTHGRHIGYVLQPTAGDAGRESDMLASVGVDVAFLHVDIGKAGVGLRRACQACEAGDVLVVAEPGRLDEATMAALLAKGAVVHALLPAGM